MISAIVPAGIAVSEIAGDLEDASLLPEEAAALGRVSEGRRREYAISRTCARRALAGLGIAPMPILSGPKREPLWPAGIVGSITHCSGYCAVAVARDELFATIGIDAEIHDELPPGVLGTVALEEELDWMRALSTAGIHWDRILFSAKESVYKAWYPMAKRWLGFKDALVTVQPESGAFHARLLGAGPAVGGQSATSFHGRYLVENGLVITAVSLSASPSRVIPNAVRNPG
jgi:4'-phosphopantetheinyl transferase EntD